MTKLKVVLDTNVYLSAIIFGGNCRHILDLILAKKITSITSLSILLEISQKLKNKFKWEQLKIEVIIKAIAKSGDVIKPKCKINAVKKDKSDNKIIEAAEEAKADFIITGDKHLLDLSKYRNLTILSPTDFISHYQQKSN